MCLISFMKNYLTPSLAGLWFLKVHCKVYYQHQMGMQSRAYGGTPRHPYLSTVKGASTNITFNHRSHGSIFADGVCLFTYDN